MVMYIEEPKPILASFVETSKIKDKSDVFYYNKNLLVPTDIFALRTINKLYFFNQEPLIAPDIPNVA
jgi:hypothetical protein